MVLVRQRVTPFIVVLAATLVAGLSAAIVVLAAVDQPWMGVSLAAEAGVDVLHIVAVAPDGPAAALPTDTSLTGIGNAGAVPLPLHASDILEDPDTVESYAAFDLFLARQDAISGVLRGGTVVLSLGDGSTFTLLPRESRPLSSLPFDFWILIIVGVVSFVSAAWTLAFRPGMAAVRVWAVGGAALLLTTFGSAIFISRELALDAATFSTLTKLNFIGSFGFTALLLVLFTIYPRCLLPRPAVALLVLAVPTWMLVEHFRVGVSSPDMGRYLPITACATGASIAALVQYVAARREPLIKVAIGWFGLAVASCTGLFVVLFVAPSLLGDAPAAPQWMSYVLALVLHASFILGILRYRLFDLEPWAFRTLYYVGGTVLFVVLDLAMVSALALGRAPAFGLSLAVIALCYLPLRDVLKRRLLPSEGVRQQLFQNVVDVAMATPASERDTRWRSLMRRAFDPLSVEVGEKTTAAAITDDGLALIIPGAGLVAPLRLGYAQGGRRLFSRRDLDLANELSAMLIHSSSSRDAYERGISAERSRIARDMHDNIGATLLSALHGQAPDRKDVLIREALSDLRGIINNVSGTMRAFDDSMADLRLETAERLSAAGIDLDWSVDGSSEARLSPTSDHTIRSIVREGVSNCLRHAKASELQIAITMAGEQVSISIADNGQGFTTPAPQTQGHGLMGIKARLEALRGSFSVSESGAGVSIQAQFPNALEAGR